MIYIGFPEVGGRSCRIFTDFTVKEDPSPDSGFDSPEGAVGSYDALEVSLVAHWKIRSPRLGWALFTICNMCGGSENRTTRLLSTTKRSKKQPSKILYTTH